MNEGWICPRCGRVNAPWISFCICKSSDKMVLNSTCSHQWVLTVVNTAGSQYTCRICGATKTESYDPNHNGVTIC